MKRIPLFLAVAAMVFFLACKGMEEAKMEPIPAADFTVVAVMHTVKDFDGWKKVYMSDDSLRNAMGMKTFTMGRGVDNPNMVYVTNKVSDLQKAKDFLNNPRLKMVMDSAGVTSAPEVVFAKVVRMDTTAPGSRLRMRVAHHVKDYDAWLKTYDGEGRTARLTYGLADRSLARDINDPNMVYITFYIMDKDKAMARFSSPELKKLMTDAGVDSEPKTLLYNTVN
ncbi:MAG: hypothetical protein ABJC12_05280 [Saprospiraceae bacterium]